MKLRISLLLGCLFFGSPGFSQNELDSLLSVIQGEPADSIKLQSYNRLSYLYNYHHTDLVLARKFADSAFQLAEDIEDEKGRIHANYHLGLVEMKEGNYAKALQHLNAYAQYYALRNDSSQVARALYSIGIIHGYQGDYQKRLDIELQMVRYYEQRDRPWDLGRTLMSLGNTYRQIDKLQEAKGAHMQALHIFRGLDPGMAYAMALQNLANVYMSLEEQDSARVLYEEALQIIQDLGRKVEEAYILTNLGTLYSDLGNFQKSLEFHLQTLDTWRELDQPKDIAEAMHNVGDVYLQLENYPSARQYYQEALLISKKLGLRNLNSQLYKSMANLYSTQNNYQQAFQFQRLHYLVKDSIFNEEKTLQMNELQVKYESEQKNQQITMLGKEKELQEKEIQRQATLKNAFIGGVILITLIATMFLYILRQRLKNQKALTAKNEEIQEANFHRKLTELEMKALQAQINPHFIFNCMNSINQLILEGSVEKASRYLTRFSKLIRLILENAESSEVTLKDELNLLESYIQLEQLRFKGKISHRIDIDESIDPQTTFLPSMVLQPFVENALWHGLMPRKDTCQGIISIVVRQNQDHLICQIEDNGIGREKALQLQQKSVWKSKSLGISLTEERLRLLGKELQRQMIRIIDLKDHLGEAQGTRVEISIPT